jgi:hypothetical protein
MKAMRTMLLAALGFALCLMAARADDAAIRKEMQTQYEAMAQAAQSGDGSALTKALPADFKYTDILGKDLSREEWAQAIRQSLADIKSLQVAATVQSVAVKGEEATSITKIKVTGDTPGEDGRPVPLEMTVTDRAVWSKGADGWKMKSARQVMIDGRQDKKPLTFPVTPEAEAVRSAIQPLYDALSTLYGKKDFDTLEKAIPENYDAKDANGTPLTRKELIERVRQGAKNLTDPIMLITVQQVAAEGGKAKAVRVLRVIADIHFPDGRTGRMRYTSVARDTWVKEKDAWANRGSEELYFEAMLDGKPVPLAAIGGK